MCCHLTNLVCAISDFAPSLTKAICIQPLFWERIWFDYVECITVWLLTTDTTTNVRVLQILSEDWLERFLLGVFKVIILFLFTCIQMSRIGYNFFHLIILHTAFLIFCLKYPVSNSNIQFKESCDNNNIKKRTLATLSLIFFSNTLRLVKIYWKLTILVDFTSHLI